MLREKDAVIRRAVIILDAFLIAFSYGVSIFLRQAFHIFYNLDLIPSKYVIAPAISASDYLVVLFFTVPLWCAILYLNGMYYSMRTRRITEIIWIIIKSVAMSVLIFGLIVFGLDMDFLSRLFFLIFVFVSTSFLIAEKLIIYSVIRYLRKEGYNFRRLIVVGSGKRTANFIKMVKLHPEWGFRIEKILDYEEKSVGKDIEGLTISGTLDSIAKLLQETPIDEVVFVIPRSGLNVIEKAIYTCENVGVKVTIAIDLFNLHIAKAKQTDLEGIPLLTFDTNVGEEWQLFIKRGVDIIISIIALIALTPVFLVVSVLIKLTSKGPVLYLQKRAGLNGRAFIMYKFRTMYVGAHQRKMEFSDLNMMKGPVFKIKDDPRVTPVGRFLRKFSLDETPQLFNVFIGHMSLVGPRPPLHKEVLQYEQWQRRRLSMRPGLTCLWQVSGRNEIGFEKWMKLDLEYIDNWSLSLDFKILLKTIPAVIFAKGAY